MRRLIEQVAQLSIDLGVTRTELRRLTLTVEGKVTEADVDPAIVSLNEGIKDARVSPWDLRRRKKNLPAIVAAIRSIDPDIIGLQEVLGPGQAQELAQTLNMNYAYGEHPASSSGISWWGLAVLSKYEILEARTITIRASRPVFPAGAEGRTAYRL